MMEMQWFACELHCHTVHSDGDFTVPKLLETAKQRGLCGIALTDHNTASGVKQALADGSLPVLGGMEWTTYFGHMPVLGARRFVDWRDATPETIDLKMQAVHNCGGICGIAHPFQLGTPICTGGFWEFQVGNPDLPDYIEVWSEGAPYANAANLRAQALWGRFLDAGAHLPPTFGRDWHRPTGNCLPTACTYLLCPAGALTAEKMLEAIRAGRTSVCVGPLFYWEADGAQIGDTLSAGEKTLTFYLDSTRCCSLQTGDVFVPQEIRVLTNGTSRVLTLPVQEKDSVLSAVLSLRAGQYYRAELWGETNQTPDTQLALTGAIYAE